MQKCVTEITGTTAQDSLPMLKRITLDDLEPIALGATFLGTGGGGDPYLGRLLTRVALERRAGGHVDVITPEALRNDDFTMTVGGMGSPASRMHSSASVSASDAAKAAASMLSPSVIASGISGNVTL